jgi:hypothetical protein
MTRSFCLFLVFTLGVLSPTELLAQLGGTIAPREELEDRGWTESYLNWLAQGYEEVSVLTPSNPSAGPRAHQIREIVRLHFSEN